MSLDVHLQAPDGTQLFWLNITHNLNRMAKEAGLYAALWRPDEANWTTAKDIIELLEVGLALLQREPARFKALDPPNGWGDYNGLVAFVSAYLNACRDFPDATICVSR